MLLFPTGQRQDNTVQQRAGSMHLKGYRFFVDDEDIFGLEDILQANMLLKTGSAYVPAKPWQKGTQNKVVNELSMLTEDAKSHLVCMTACALPQ